MRPPAIQAERSATRRRCRRQTRGFNEAACNTGGTQESSPWHPSRKFCFNEAACNTGGTPWKRAQRLPAPPLLQ